jgi:hypothetical protein
MAAEEAFSESLETLSAATATGVVGGIRAVGTRGAGREFPHWIPNGRGGPRSIWNGNYVTSVVSMAVITCFAA